MTIQLLILFLVHATSYCTPSSSNPFLVNLDLVSLNNLLHTATSCSGHSTFEDYPNGPVALLAPATTYLLELSFSACGGVTKQSLEDLPLVNLLVWIDWNNNDEFEISEQVLSSNVTASSALVAPTVVTASITPPPDSALSTTMRVMATTSSNTSDSCATDFVGVVYDFPVWLKSGPTASWCDSVLVQVNQPDNTAGWSMVEGVYDLMTASSPTGSTTWFPVYQRQDRFIWLSFSQTSTDSRWSLNNGQGSVWCQALSDQWTPDTWSWGCWNATLGTFIDFPFIEVSCATGLTTPTLAKDLPSTSPVSSVLVTGSFSWQLNGVYTFKDTRNGAVHYTRQPNQTIYDAADPYHLYLVGRIWYIDDDDTLPVVSGYSPDLGVEIRKVNRSWSCCFDYGVLSTTWFTWNDDLSQWQSDNITIHPITYSEPVEATCSLNTMPSSCSKASGCGVCIPTVNATIVVNGNTVNASITSVYPVCTHVCAGQTFGDEGKKPLLSFTYIIIIAVVGFVVFLLTIVLCCFIACRCWRKAAAKVSSHITPAEAGSGGAQSGVPASKDIESLVPSGASVSSDGMVVIGPLGRPVKVFPAPEGQPLPEGMVPVLLLPVDPSTPAEPPASSS